MTTSTSAIQYSIVIPVYNTTRVLGELQQRIQQVFSSQIRQAYEIVLVDDNSPNPGTWPVVEELVRKHQNISGIRLSRNFGQHAALICGMAHANGAYILTMDDDLQHAPEDIPALVSMQEHDVVIGQFPQKKHSAARNLSSSMKACFDRILSGKPRKLRINSFCLIRRSVVDQMLAVNHMPYPFFSSLIFHVTRDVVGIPVSHSPRQEGRSGYSWFRLIQLFSRLLINNSRLVFRFVAWSGAVLLLVCIFILIGLLLGELFFQDVPGWLFLGFGLLLSNGFLLLTLGILGVSLSRIAAATKQKKPYLIQQRI